MNEINIYRFDGNIKVFSSGEKVSLPKDYEMGMEKHWDSEMSKRKNYFRGDIFTIQSITQTSECIKISVDLSDFAHFLYTMKRNKFSNDDCRIFYTSALIETSDGKFVIGEMHGLSAYPIQFIGGGIDKDDLNGNAIDIEHNIRKEISEEIGIDTYDYSLVKSLKPYYLKDGGKTNFVSAIFKLDLNISEYELVQRFNDHNKCLMYKGLTPEINSLIFVSNNKESVARFLVNYSHDKDENLIATLKAAVGLYPVKEFDLNTINKGEYYVT